MIAVVVFHFNPQWLPGGFAGVDVFFVISGFLMTSIICRGLEKGSFSTWQFYMARANRIIPALAAVCAVLMLFGWVYLLPDEYAALGKHVAGSVSFLSNFVYWMEAGYFDASSHEKWLLHSWSLSVEWQFYLIYPLILLAFTRLWGVARLKWLVLGLTIAGFIYSAVTSALWPSASYYLLATRAWELMFGGLAYLFPVVMTGQRQRVTNLVGIALIVVAYATVSESNPWPGSLAIIPVLGTYLVILAAQQNSVFTNNAVFQPLGRWSYSIYLWHWPVVVFGYRYDISYWWIPGLLLSVLLGWLSYRLVENIKWQRVSSVFATWRAKPVWMAALMLVMGITVLSGQGLVQRFDPAMQAMIKSVEFSPLRDKCHVNEYQNPHDACEYLNDNVTWAVFGDSHTVEIAYALAVKLDARGESLKHYSFSGCAPQQLDMPGNSKCSAWYKDAVQDILDDERIQSVLINHRYSWSLFGDHAPTYPALPDQHKPERTARVMGSLDTVIEKLASVKQHVYVMLPVPEIGKSAPAVLAYHYAKGEVADQITGTSMTYYLQRNKAVLAHFAGQTYPDNVTLLDPTKAFCEQQNCYVIDKGKSLYFDNNHPSMTGARKLVELLPDELATQH